MEEELLRRRLAREVVLSVCKDTWWAADSDFYLPHNDYYCHRLSTVDSSLWLPSTSIHDRDDKVLIYSPDSHIQQVISAKQHGIVAPAAVLQVSGKHAMITSHSGLWLHNTTTNSFDRLCAGKFSALAQYDGTVYALNMTHRQISEVRQTDGRWQVVGQLNITTPLPYLMNKSDTMFVTSGHIYICSYHETTVFTCSRHDGAVIDHCPLQSLTSRKAADPIMYNVVLCGVTSKQTTHSEPLVKLDDDLDGQSVANELVSHDQDVSFLAIDVANELVVVLTYDGERWTKVSTGFQLNHPVDVMVQGDHTLWFLCNHGNKIVKYTKR